MSPFEEQARASKRLALGRLTRLWVTVSARPSEMLTHSATMGSALRSMAETCCLLGACACAVQAYAQESPAREQEGGQANTPVSRGPQTCGKNPAVYWAGAGPKVQVLRHGSFRRRKALEPEGASTDAVVVEVRIDGKSAFA